MNKTTKLPEGPTLNGSYNQLLLDWKAQGAASDPACEWCERDLTGQEVKGTRLGWFCVECYDDGHGHSAGDHGDHATRRAESGYAQ